MRRLYNFIPLIFIPLAYILLTAEIGSSSGSAGGKTGSPGDNGITCTQCHGGMATMQSGWITSTIPASGYETGQTYTITATGTHVGVGKFGFEVTAEDAAGNKTGTIVLTTPSETKLVNGNAAITHLSAGTTPSGNSRTWTFNWISPPTTSGTITFYGAFNAANGTGNTSGDVIYTSTLIVTPSTVGIEEALASSAATYFPNPATDKIIFNKDLGDEIVVDIYSIDGRLQSSALLKNQYTMSLAGLDAGTYILSIASRTGKITKTLVKK